MKSLLDIQKDIRNLENDIAVISANIKQINDDIDELRNKDNNVNFDYYEIEKLSKLIPFKEHPISKIDDTSVAQLYLEMILNIVKFDDKNNEDKVDTRLVFIQWLLNNSKINITLEELIASSLKAHASDFDKINTQLTKEYKELLVVDLLIVANINGIFNADECDYVVNMLTILGIKASKLKTLALIAKIVLCQKKFKSDFSSSNDLAKEFINYRHYSVTNNLTNAVKEAIKSMRTIAVEIRSDDGKDFNWKCKQQDKVTCGAVIATYQKKRGYYFNPEYETKEIIAPADGTIFQFGYNNVIYGVISHEADNKNSIKNWIKNTK